jgi:hypothetical protein
LYSPWIFLHSVLAHVDAAVVEGHQLPAHLHVVHAEGAAGVELGIEAVLGGSLQVLRRQLFLVFLAEPLVGHRAVPEVLVDIGAPVNDGRDAVLSQHF